MWSFYAKYAAVRGLNFFNEEDEGESNETIDGRIKAKLAYSIRSETDRVGIGVKEVVSTRKFYNDCL